ncbi:hypothetical protein [Nocardia nova]|uniref:hypothetical protein n=1 Tax=Nocardia nova TaxID=37330 RepID=UPI001895A919|nr:hypothetical protein [Nocardia nova]MBF6277020.1 hypothetical protein [Nocardia nova]
MPERQSIRIQRHRAAQDLAIREAIQRVQATDPTATDFAWEGYEPGRAGEDGHHKIGYLSQG